MTSSSSANTISYSNIEIGMKTLYSVPILGFCFLYTDRDRGTLWCSDSSRGVEGGVMDQAASQTPAALHMQHCRSVEVGVLWPAKHLYYLNIYNMSCYCLYIQNVYNLGALLGAPLQT